MFDVIGEGEFCFCSEINKKLSTPTLKRSEKKIKNQTIIQFTIVKCLSSLVKSTLIIRLFFSVLVVKRSINDKIIDNNVFFSSQKFLFLVHSVW